MLTGVIPAITKYLQRRYPSETIQAQPPQFVMARPSPGAPVRLDSLHQAATAHVLLIGLGPASLEIRRSRQLVADQSPWQLPFAQFNVQVDSRLLHDGPTSADSIAAVGTGCAMVLVLEAQ